MLLPAKVGPKAWKAAVEVWPKGCQEERWRKREIRGKEEFCDEKG